MASERPVGQRFSHVYLAGGEPKSDSTRMRGRFGSNFCKYRYGGFGDVVAEEVGVKVYDNGKYSSNWTRFFGECDLRDILDIVTLYYKFLVENEGFDNEDSEGFSWIADVRKIFAEERIAYNVDDKGGVHFSVDAEFSRNATSALAILNGSRYANARAAFEAAFTALDAVPPDGKSALRQVFFSTEGLFKVLYPKADLLGGNTVDSQLIPHLKKLYAHDEAASASATLMAKSFREWIFAAHKYRHEPGTEEVSQVPLALAVLMISQGAGFIRWLAELDTAQTAKS